MRSSHSTPHPRRPFLARLLCILAALTCPVMPAAAQDATQPSQVPEPTTPAPDRGSTPSDTAAPNNADTSFDLTLTPGAAAEHPWHVTALIGQADQDRFIDILRLEGGSFESSYIAGIAAGREIAHMWDDLRWELDASIYRHWGEQDHWEANAALVARWVRFPWEDYLYTGAALGSGMSLATDRPTLDDSGGRWQHHLLAEIELGPPHNRRFTVVGRLHHRSGMFGLYGNHGGENYITAGLRWRF